MFISAIPNCLIYLYSGVEKRIWPCPKRPILIHFILTPSLKAIEDAFVLGFRCNTVLTLEAKQMLEDCNVNLGYKAKAILTKQKNKSIRGTGRQSSWKLSMSNRISNTCGWEWQDFHLVSCEQKYFQSQVLVSASGMGFSEETIGLSKQKWEGVCD